MSSYFRPSAFGFGLLLTLTISQLTSAATVEEMVNKLLDEALTATTMDIADQKLDEADKLLNKAKRMDELERDFLYADINQTRGRIRMAWAKHRRDINMLNNAYGLLLSVSDDYENLIKRCEDKADQSTQRRRNLPTESRRLQEIEGNKIRAKYKWAWAEYYVADTSDTNVREARFNSALEKFSEFTEEGDPNQPYIADCFIGRAQCLYELKRYPEIIELLDPDTFKPDYKKSPNIFKRATLERMKAYQATSSHKMAEDSAKRYFDTLPEDSKLDAIDLEITILRIPSLGALYNNDQSLRARCDELRNLIKPYGIQWRTRLSEELYRIGIKTPEWYLSEADKNLKARDFEEALNYAETGLKGRVEVFPPSNRGQDTRDTTSEEELCANLRYIKFVACWRLNQWRQAHIAAKEFLEYYPKDSRATEVCGWAFKSGMKALESDPPLETGSFLKFLEDAEKNFPENPEIENAPWYIGYLRFQDGQYPASQKMLEKIEPNSQFYNQVQYYLALACYKQAKALIEAGENKPQDITKLLGDTVAALDRLAQNLPEGEFQLSRHSVTLAIETSRCLLNLNPPDPEKVLELIENEKMQKIQNVVHQSEDEWLVQRIKANLMAGNINPAAGLIETLPGKATTANPFIEISKLLEQTSGRLIENHNSADAESIDKKLVMIYTTLLDNYISKSSDEQMRANEPLVRVLLANCYLRLREYQKAIDHYEWYMSNAPKGKSPDVVRSLAIAYEQTKSYDQALQQWRTLYRGLKRRTNKWIEAGYHLIWCHIRSGNLDHARKVLEHFELLCPRSELGEWGQKFDALKEELLPTDTSPNP
jgi:tetratricopeptide (TPR) repeat protein